MENPLDVTASAPESQAATIQRLAAHVAALERTRVIPASIVGASLAALKAQLPASAPNNTIIIGRRTGAEPNCYIYVYNESTSKWYFQTLVEA